MFFLESAAQVCRMYFEAIVNRIPGSWLSHVNVVYNGYDLLFLCLVCGFETSYQVKVIEFRRKPKLLDYGWKPKHNRQRNLTPIKKKIKEMAATQSDYGHYTLYCCPWFHKCAQNENFLLSSCSIGSEGYQFH